MATHKNPSAISYKAICDYLRFNIDSDKVFRTLEDCLKQLGQDKENLPFDFLGMSSEQDSLNSKVIHYYLARLAFVHDRMEEAESHLKVLLDHPILFPGVYQFQGYLNIFKGDYEASVEAFDKELQFYDYEQKQLENHQREPFMQTMLGKIHALQILNRYEDIAAIQRTILQKLQAIQSAGKSSQEKEQNPKLTTSEKTKNRLEFEETTKVFSSNNNKSRKAMGIAILLLIVLALLGFYLLQLGDRKESKDSEPAANTEERKDH